MGKLKVLLVLHELTRTGAPRVAIEAFEALRDSVELRVIALQDGPYAERCASLGSLEVLSRRWLVKKPWGRLSNRIGLWSYAASLRRWRPDVIYVNSTASLPIALYNIPL